MSDSLTLEFEGTCKVCGASVEIEILPAGMWGVRRINIEPCAACLAKARDEAASEEETP